MNARTVEILDTTLRDGVQSAGVVFSLEDKIKLVRALDSLGVRYIEAGNPFSNPKDAELFRFARDKLKLKNARLAAFGMTRRPGAAAEDDPGLRAILDSGAHIASIVGKSCAFQVREVLGKTLEENLRMIEDTVRFLTESGMAVFFDAEHFFDGYSDDPDYALETLRAAERGGAERLVLCDTNGGTLPGAVAGAVKRAVAEFRTPIAIHCHNDAGLATAATLLAVEAGAMQVQGTINGYGERCGNANLCEVIPNLELKMGLRALPEGSLPELLSIARFISELANLNMDEAMPYVGHNAFAHKGGMHIDGVLKNRRSFEHIDPALVGNRRRLLISEVAGRSALLTRLEKLAPELNRDSEETVRILETLKALEADGYSFEDADGSLTLRILGALGRRPAFFRVLDFHVFSRQASGPLNAQAYVKVLVGDRVEITADEGDGPVNALDLALRKALSRFYPVLGHMRLQDFKVRVVSGTGTASAVRVRIDSTDGETVFSTVGVSTNVIEASFIALSDSIDCLLMHKSAGRA
ncbi:MAG: citramalate synthase [Clostridiales bacterium]|jgi:2-isopropylmalate synthase|nr:citramalate synthase [Clostridiales bacterium]OPZ69428.1 MAG: 2-isopropylmalate synthase [Firmicutes bacterium ADurb.Bin467]